MSEYIGSLVGETLGNLKVKQYLTPDSVKHNKGIFPGGENPFLTAMRIQKRNIQNFYHAYIYTSR